MSFLKVKIGTVKISKPKRISTGITRVTNKIQKGKVVKEGDVYKVAINMEDSDVNPSYRALEFTERSYEVKGRTTVFSRTFRDDGRIVRIIRNIVDARCLPGTTEQYIPFEINWIVKGYIVKENNVVKFDFKDLVCVDGYDNYIMLDEN